VFFFAAWRLCEKKIISREGAEAQREWCFSLCLGGFARKKIISREDAKPQGGGVFVCVLAALREKKSFHAKARRRKGEATPLPFSIFQLLEDMKHLFFREAGLQAEDMNGNAEPEPGDYAFSFSKLAAFFETFFSSFSNELIV
jgi:hypothetical protein